ncbi:MAG: hypothetical protein QOE24_3102 [Frankiales bacterium]|jgi:hypothetical protein|nr:hypothetical protein [Frankiales bacterium]
MVDTALDVEVGAADESISVAEGKDPVAVADVVGTGVVAAALVGAVLVVCSDGRTAGFVLLLLHPASTTALTRPTVTAAKPREVIRMGGILDDSQASSLLAVHRLHPFSPERPVRP